MTELSIKIEDLVKDVVQNNASDLHLAVGRRPIIRVSGSLIHLTQYKLLEKKDIEGVLASLLSKKEIDQFNTEKELDFAHSFNSNMRFRINLFVTRGNPAIAMRYLSDRIRTIEELELPRVLYEFTKLTQGFVLVTGPVGQGKSTTLAAMINEINHTRQENIITIEDPIEFLYTQDRSMISQREVGLDTNSFSNGLKGAFREDVDVILIGELRDIDTMRAAVTAAETGHLVFATLHTNSASQTITRIIDGFPAGQQNQIRTQLASSLAGIISQRLIPSVEGGLIPAVEILIVNNGVRNMIRENKIYQIDSIIETSFREGMIGLNRSLYDLVKRDIVSYEIAMNYSLQPQELALALKR